MSTHNLSVIMTGNATSLRGALMASGREVDSFTKKVENSGKSGMKAGQLLKMGFAAAAVAVGVALAYSVAQAAAFDKEMRNVQSITKVSDSQLQDMGSTLIDMSTKLPQSATTLAAGLYEIASSGFQGADGLKVLEASAISASAGLTTTNVAAKAITSVLNAYGLSADHATDVSDVLFQTVNVGVVTFEELAGTIGDVVGTAAAATVEVDELASAVATMTLSGISASEAGTSLNRLIQSLIDPSEELAAALNEVGYESGATALQTDSLSTVIEKLRVASDGNIETLLKWFPEIRAARGALALMSNEGANYARVVADIENKESRAGAARAALTEQMKSASAQWEIFKNRINAGAIIVGSKMLPGIISLLGSITSLAQQGLPILLDALKRLNPFFEAMWQHAKNLVDIAGELASVFGPVIGMFAALGGVLAINALNLFAEALETVSGFLADHPALIQAVAIVLLSAYLPAVIASATATGTLAAETAILKAMYAGDAIRAGIQNVAARMLYMKDALYGLTAQMSGGVSVTQNLKAAFSGLGASLAVGAAIFAVTKAVQEYSNQVNQATEDGKKWADSFAGDFDPARASMAELEGEIQRLNGAADQMQEAADNAINPFLDDRLKTARDELHETAKPLEEIRDRAKMLQDELGITSEKALRYASDSEFMAQATDQATGELDKEAAAALDVQESLAELSDQLKAMYDPLFGLQDAASGLAKAQADAAAAAKEHGAGSKEAAEANRAAIEAAVDYQSAIINLKASIADGTTDIETSIATLYAWADAGIITEEQAKQSEKEIRGLKNTADKTDGTKVIVTAHAETETAKQRLADYKAFLASIPRTITTELGVRPNVDYRQGQYAYQGRWGGVLHSYQGGGLHAHVARNEMIRYAEPATGGEAFVPRKGDRSRSTAVLNEAASWYGYGLVKMAQGGVTRYDGGMSSMLGTAVRVILDAKGVDRALLEVLRKMIRVEGGGNVQVALGQGAG